MKQISIWITVLLWLVCFGGGANSVIAQAGQGSIELSSRALTPGATLVLNGNGFGTFKSTRFNRVTVNGVPALPPTQNEILIFDLTYFRRMYLGKDLIYFSSYMLTP